MQEIGRKNDAKIVGYEGVLRLREHFSAEQSSGTAVGKIPFDTDIMRKYRFVEAVTYSIFLSQI